MRNFNAKSKRMDPESWFEANEYGDKLKMIE
jgi:hypothetical protein